MTFKHNSFSEGHGFPLVFQHGLTANMNQIFGLLGGLPDVQLCGIDCPGHGQSHLGNFHPSFDNYADEVIKYMNHFGIDSSIIGGLSMGSGIAINMALRYPERVKGLILHRPAWLATADPQNLMILKEAIPFMDKTNGASLFTANAAFQTINNQLPTAAKSIMDIFSNSQQRQLPVVIEHMVGDAPFNSIDELDNINVPCLVLGNEDDPLHPYEMAEVIHQKIEGSSLKKITSRYIDGNLHRTQLRGHISNFIKQVNAL